jgi:hypothetical protein
MPYARSMVLVVETETGSAHDDNGEPLFNVKYNDDGIE